MIYKIKIIYLLSLLLLSSQTKANPIEIDINPADGTYKININKTEWLSSVETFLQANGKFYSSLDNSLLISGIDIKSGEDQIGTWTSTGIRYALNDSLIEVFECEIIKYIDLPFIRFKQNFLKDLKDVERNNTDYVSTSCPSFSVSKEMQTSLGFLSFGDNMMGDDGRTMGRWSNQSKQVNDGILGGPLILFDQNGNTLILSSMSNFMSASMQYSPINNGSMYFGVMAGASFIPQSYSMDFIVYLSTEGINKAFEGWGDLLRNYYNKTQIENDLVIDYLGYWTDEGAYYYYNTEEGKNYEDTILDIISNFTGEVIPYRYIEYDSWWYRLNSKEPGCVIWDTPAEVFPSGMVGLYGKTNLKSTAHAKFWSNLTVYATENGGKYEFLIDKNSRMSLPVDQTFWDDLFYNASKWGLQTYEQDWMNDQTRSFKPLISNVTLGRDWLIQMGRGAAKYNVSILYCMSLSRHILQSLEVPQVAIARASTDYINMIYHGKSYISIASNQC